MTTETTLEEAVRSAVEQGHAELTRLDGIVDDLVTSFAKVPVDAQRSAALMARFDDLVRAIPDELRCHLDRERDSLGSFNIAFFGRTGAGKSTLLSAFGQLDGRYVSPGFSDFTTDVRHLEWRGCRLYDTPGINGWGRTESRANLEAKARRAVEIADVVLLCFDNQSQQAMEFEKIAAWIRDHGKPVVAVLNVKNLHWRLRERVPEIGRKRLSESVRQHADNIRTELAQIGLPETPIVAVQSRRALFARATTPYNGPAQVDFHRERDEFKPDALARWSNFGTLEQLIANSISEGGAELRLGALREDLRSRCHRAAADLETLAADIEQEAISRERAAEAMLAVIGYPDDAERATWLNDSGADLIALSETARGKPYTSPAKGMLDSHIRHIASSHLAGCRRQAKANADDLVTKAFDEGRSIDEAEFTKIVFDDVAFATVADAVWTDRRTYLQRRIDSEVDHVASYVQTADAHAAEILGDAGTGVMGQVLRGGGIAVGAGGLVVPALVNFWNPGGWALGAIAAGAGIAGFIQQRFGKRMNDREEENARAAKAQARADCHRAVTTTFDNFEDALVGNSRAAAWKALAPLVAESLTAAIELRATERHVARLIDRLRIGAGSIASAPAATDVLRRAQRRLAESPRDLACMLLGEDWLESGEDHRTPQFDRTGEEAYTSRQDSDRRRLRRALVTAWRTPSPEEIRSWQKDLEEAARRDSMLFDIARRFWRIDNARPALTVLGDYNSGKSSLIRRLLVDAGQEPPVPFDIRAVPATASVQSYRFLGFDLVDTPGLQGGHDEHTATTVEAITAAALVIVVVHINLLVGNTAVLEDTLRGSELTASKGRRTVFLINRCDELGVDPLTSPDAFLALADRKRDELREAFAARLIPIESDRIHCLAADPFGLVGAETAAVPGDFDGNRLWDGVAALTDVLSGLTNEQLTAATVSAAFDNSVADLKRFRLTLHQVQVDGATDVRQTRPIIAALQTALTEAAAHRGALRESAWRMVHKHAAQAQSVVETVGLEDAQKLERIVESWWKEQQFETDLEQYLSDAARTLDDWFSEHSSTVGREMRAAAFSASPQFAAEFKARGSVWYEDLTEGAGKAAGAAEPIMMLLGNRDAVYNIGKRVFRYKFKPWGAVKGGANVYRAGFVLGVVAAAIDTASMVNDIRHVAEHKLQQDSANQAIDEAAAEIVEQIVRGERDSGPIGYLEQRTKELDALLDEHLQVESAIRERMEAAKSQADSVAALIDSAEHLTGAPGRNE